MAKTATFNQNMIAKGYNNFSGLTNIELIPVGGHSAEPYLPRVNDLGIQYTRKVTGDGLVRRDGFATAQWLAAYMSFAQRTYIKMNILDGNDSGKVTIKTRLDDVPFDDTMTDIYVITNAILTLPPLPDGDQYNYGLRQFSYDFTRIDLNSLLHEDKMYGEIYVKDGSTSQDNISTAVKLTGFATNGESSGTTVSNSDDSITVVVAGKYLFNFSITFTSTASTKWTFGVRVDGAEGNFLCDAETNATPDAISTSMSGILDLAAAEVVTIYVESDGGGTEDITMVHGKLSIVSI
jgi:hypothetical protein